MIIECRCETCGRQLELKWKKVLNKSMVQATVAPCETCSQSMFNVGRAAKRPYPGE